MKKIHEENVDESYDNTLNSISNLVWLPWIGRNFKRTNKKTMILGESFYNSTRKERREDKEFLRRHIQRNALNYNSSENFVRNIERAIFCVKNPSNRDTDIFWRSTIYHNLVLRRMPTLEHRPTFNDYKKGWETFLELAKELEIEQCIVYGLEGKKLKAIKTILKEKEVSFKTRKLETKIGRTSPRVMDIVVQDVPVKVIFIRHPSAFFSWKKWGEILRSEFTLPEVLEIPCQSAK